MPFVKAGDKWYDVIKQSAAFSCGMACAAMVMKKKQGNHLSEVDFHNESSPHRTKAGEYKTRGTGLPHVAWVLKKWKVTTTQHGLVKANHVLLMLLRQASKKTPVVLGLRWTVGGGHLIVSPGMNTLGNKWIALDPAGQASEQDIADLPEYKIGHFVGVIDGALQT